MAAGRIGEMITEKHWTTMKMKIIFSWIDFFLSS